ncbi:MAG: hypothetical protein ACHQ2F_13145 [Desulfobaccales bacterium]
MKELDKLPYDTFGPKLRDLLTATANKLDREWPRDRPQHSYSPVMLLSLILVATNVYDSMRYLCADTPSNPSRKPEFVLALPSLSRVVLEALFTLVFALDDLEAHTEWYHKSGWRDVREELDRIKDRYGSDPRWQDYISQLETLLQGFKGELRITDDEEQDFKKSIKHWPLPSQMKKHKKLSSERKLFLEYLEDWFYKALSQDAHLSLRGLARHSRYLLFKRNRENDPREMIKQKSEIIGATVVLLLALMSEIEVEFSFGLATRLAYVWVIINSAFPQGQEIYNLRYADKLRAA